MTEPFLGTVMIWAPNFAPRGWAFCQGQLLAISTNSALFSLLGTVYGGNGQTTFGLPNLAGRVPIGQGQSPGTSTYTLGETSGTEHVTLTTAQMPMHNHAATLSGVTVAATMQASNAPTSANTTVPAQGSYLTASPAAPVGPSAQIYSTSPDPSTLVGLSGVIANVTGGTVAVAPNGSSLPFSILQPFQVLNYVIALQGVFPSRN